MKELSPLCGNRPAASPPATRIPAGTQSCGRLHGSQHISEPAKVNAGFSIYHRPHDLDRYRPSTVWSGFRKRVAGGVSRFAHGHPCPFNARAGTAAGKAGHRVGEASPTPRNGGKAAGSPYEGQGRGSTPCAAKPLAAGRAPRGVFRFMSGLYRVAIAGLPRSGR
jgi:hypothetical protein